jgi:hypothetical protein
MVAQRVAKRLKMCFTRVEVNMENKAQSPAVMHSFKGQSSSSMSPGIIIVLFLVVLILGAGAGFGLSKYASSGGRMLITLPAVSSVQAGKIYGSNDTTTFKDTAEGVLQNGGIDGEGQYHLVRSGGSSQDVYMTSSTLDLSQFLGKSIKVWGQTQAAQKAGWLMDVGRVQVL